MGQAGRASLLAALDHCGVKLDAEQVTKTERYCAALWDWNQRINLTRHVDYERFVSRDVVDAMQLADHLRQAEEVLDVGSGGGVPGVLLAILRPDLKITLSESVAKKARALAEIAKATELTIDVRHDRAEDLLSEIRFDSLTARAVGPLVRLLKWFAPHWERFDRLLLIQGPNWVQQRGEARHLGLMADLALRKIASYRSPLGGAESVILEIRPKSSAD